MRFMIMFRMMRMIITFMIMFRMRRRMIMTVSRAMRMASNSLTVNRPGPPGR